MGEETGRWEGRQGDGRRDSEMDRGGQLEMEEETGRWRERDSWRWKEDREMERERQLEMEGETAGDGRRDREMGR